MKVAHFCPFAPNASGMYETARDMIMAERQAGMTAEMVDVGVLGKRVPAKGLADERGGTTLTTISYDDARDFDLFVINQNIRDKYVAETKAPCIQVLHGQPSNTFYMQDRGGGLAVLDLYAYRATQPRYRLFLTLWSEYLNYWRSVVPDPKLRATRFPPCDLDRYTPRGPAHAFRPEGEFNVLIADVERRDCRNGARYYLAHGAMLAARHIPGLKVHFYSCPNPLGAWKHVFARMRAMKILGETYGHMWCFEQVLRGADLVVSGREMATRIIRESLACGTPVVAARCNRHIPEEFTCVPECDQSVARAILRAYTAIHKDPDRVYSDTVHAAHCFNLEDFGNEIKTLYEETCN